MIRICLFEDGKCSDLEPLTLTRPAFELLCGTETLASKQHGFFAAPGRSAPPSRTEGHGTSSVLQRGPGQGVLVRPHLEAIYRLEHPETPINDLDWLQGEPVLLVNGRWLPPPAGRPDNLDGPCVGLVEDEVAFAWVTPEHLACFSLEELPERLEALKRTLPRRPAGGKMFHYLWEIIAGNAEQITLDWECIADRLPTFLAPVPTLVGPPDRLVIDRTARVDPMVVADTTAGPVIIAREAVIHPFTRLEGPCYIGPRGQVLGARIRAGTTLGRECRVGGEVEASIIQGYSNKYHDGFLGHAYLGEWVNLGAGTHTSDLRNDYGEVTVTVNGRRRNTGLTKVGSFIGDHTKTGLGTLLNTGTSVGIFCNLLPAGLLPRYIPSFLTCTHGSLQDLTDFEALSRTAGKVMQRRGKRYTEAHLSLYRTILEQTARERQRSIRDSEAWRLRRGA
jgi:UDP-N-acetylglucosamine diphosphorylase/glucosamine-1-phosphate N-acetyltransferase